MWCVFRRDMDGTETLIARSRSKTAAHDYAERLEEDWDDPSGATYTCREIQGGKVMEKVSIKSKIAYRLRAIMAAIRGEEISFVFSQIEKWFKGELISQKITNAVYESDVFMELSQEYDRKLAEKLKEAK